MCSVLLILLISYVLFGFLENTVPKWSTAQTASPSASRSSSSLAFALQGTCGIKQTCFAETSANTFSSSFQRQRTYCKDTEASQHGQGFVAVEVQSMFPYQPQDGAEVRNLLCTLEYRDTPQQGAQAIDILQGGCRLGRRLDWMGKRSILELGKFPIEKQQCQKLQERQVRCTDAEEQSKEGQRKKRASLERARRERATLGKPLWHHPLHPLLHSSLHGPHKTLQSAICCQWYRLFHHRIQWTPLLRNEM